MAHAISRTSALVICAADGAGAPLSVCTSNQFRKSGTTASVIFASDPWGFPPCLQNHKTLSIWGHCRQSLNYVASGKLRQPPPMPVNAVTLVLLVEFLMIIGFTVRNKYILYQKTKSFLLF